VQPGSPADWHGSFNTRADRIFSTLQQICSSAQMQSVCSMDNLAYHPHFPGNEPPAEPRFRLQEWTPNASKGSTAPALHDDLTQLKSKITQS
jgi:hypothetical protein